MDAPSVFLVIATILVGECKTYWQLLLCQGLVVGTCCGMIFGPVLTVVGHWFRRKRASALGVASFGGAVGGVIFPIAARRLFEEVGWVISTQHWAGCDDKVSKVSLDDAYHCLGSVRYSRCRQPRKWLLDAPIACHLPWDKTDDEKKASSSGRPRTLLHPSRLQKTWARPVHHRSGHYFSWSLHECVTPVWVRHIYH